MPTLPDRKSARQLPLFPDPEPLSEAKLKEAVRTRDGLRCTVCGMTADEHVRAYGQTLQVHRIVPGSEYTVEGCTTLCIPCHAQKSVGRPRHIKPWQMPRKAKAEPKPKKKRGDFPEDLTGILFGRWMVLGPGSIPRNWLVECTCGSKTRKEVADYSLTSGHSTSCGCKRVERPPNTKHGKGRSPEYAVWAGVKQRCFESYNRNYCRYGAKGITMCAGWRFSFESFTEDLGPRTTPKHQLDRIDNSIGYFCGHCDECLEKGWPANCRWVTRKENLRNTCRNAFVEYRGERLTIMDWAERIGIPYRTLYVRIQVRKWPIERALETANWDYVQKIPYRGGMASVAEIARAEGVDYFWLRNRIVKQGMSAEDALRTPNMRKPVIVTYQGETMSLDELVRRTGMKKVTLRQRIVKLGISADDAVSTPLQRGKKLNK